MMMGEDLDVELVEKQGKAFEGSVDRMITSTIWTTKSLHSWTGPPPSTDAEKTIPETSNCNVIARKSSTLIVII